MVKIYKNKNKISYINLNKSLYDKLKVYEHPKDYRKTITKNQVNTISVNYMTHTKIRRV